MFGTTNEAITDGPGLAPNKLNGALVDIRESGMTLGSKFPFPSKTDTCPPAKRMTLTLLVSVEYTLGARLSKVLADSDGGLRIGGSRSLLLKRRINGR
jgi:hypothetical protein